MIPVSHVSADHRTWLSVSALLALFAAAQPAQADMMADLGITRLLTTCEPQMTVQKQSCEVTSFWRCPDGGILARTSWNDQPEAYESYDRDYNLRFSVRPADEVGMLSVTSISDPRTLSNLLAGGFERTDFRSVVRLILPAPREIDAWQELRLTGETVMLDGVELLVMQSTSSLAIGTGGQESLTEATSYYAPLTGMMLGGSYTMTFQGMVITDVTADPLAIALPGDPGFLSETPAFCGENLSQLAPHPGDAA